MLTPQETEKLFDVLRNMRADGKAIVIITHKLHEVMALSDKVAVLRKGQYIGTVNTSETNPQALTDMMVGHAVTPEHRPARRYENPVPAPDGAGRSPCCDNEGVKSASTTCPSPPWAARSWASRASPARGQRELLESIAGLYPVGRGHQHPLYPRAATSGDASWWARRRMQINKVGRRPGLRPGGPPGHGPGRRAWA